MLDARSTRSDCGISSLPPSSSSNKSAFHRPRSVALGTGQDWAEILVLFPPRRFVEDEDEEDDNDDESVSDASGNDAGGSDVEMDKPSQPQLDLPGRIACKRASPVFKSLLRSKGFAWMATRPKMHGEWSQAGVMLTLQGVSPVLPEFISGTTITSTNTSV